MSSSIGYEVVRRLAQGRAAELFLARVPGIQQDVVVKLLLPELSQDPEVSSRFIDEAKLCQSLKHPNVVGHLGGGRDADGRLFQVTEYLDGQDLKTHLRGNSPLTPEQLVQLMLPLCAALEYVHNQGVLHRDIKPDNVVLVGGLEAFHPKLIDFGNAWSAGNATRTAQGQRVVTPEYVAPECIGGSPETRSSDLYALGALMYECLIGTPPFVAPDMPSLLKMHLEHPVPALPEGYGAVQPIIARCLAKNPLDRFGNAAEVAQALIDAYRPKAAPHPGLPSASWVMGPAPARTTSESVPMTLGSYQILKLLGEGRMGQVYLARHAKLGKHVALKVLRREHAQNRELVLRFFQEARAVNQINHEHIVEIHDFIEEGPGGRVYCVMEMLTGASLSGLLRKGPLEVRRTVSMVRQMCQGLAAAHSLGVVHRDIKPDNIFICQKTNRPDYVKVLDFGLAKLLVTVPGNLLDSSIQGIVLGTPMYMAPEQASGKPVDSRADIYSVGTVLYEMLSGRTPFRAETFGELIVQLHERAPPELPACTPAGDPISPALRHIVKRCLEKAPERRFPSMEQLESALSQVSSSPPDDEEILQKALPHRRWLLPASVALGLALVVTAVALPRKVELPPPPPIPSALSKPAPPEPAVQERVTLAFTTRPSGAEVTRLDSGEKLGMTPLAWEVEPDGQEVLLRLELNGYEPVIHAVRLNANAQVEIALVSKVLSGQAAAGKRVIRKKPNKGVSRDAVMDPYAP